MVQNMKSLVALLGDPVSHSLSPQMHNAGFEHLGIDMNYMAFRVPPEELDSALKGLSSLGAVGTNITVPHKAKVFRLVDSMSVSATNSGAVNTVVFNGRKLEGHNTDIFGVKKVVSVMGPETDKAVVLGAGGAARAVVCALAEKGYSMITVYNRSISRSMSLKKDLENAYKDICIEVKPWGEIREQGKCLLVNATSLGLDANPWPNGMVEKIFLSSEVIALLDMVYSKNGKTDLVQEASEKGIPSVGGEEVLLYQGVAAFETFTGKMAPVEVMRQALMQGVVLS